MIVLDTHMWLFMINGGLEDLSANARKAIQKTGSIGVSVISCWEIAMLVAKGRLRFSIDVQDWIDVALRYPGIKRIDITPKIAVLSTRLPGKFHKDPADRIIVASCLKLDAALVTLDERIRNWGHIKTIY